MTAPTERSIDDATAIRLSWREPEAFATLYDRHATALHRFVTRRLGAAAEDIVADCFLAAFRQRAKYDLSRTDARPWLYGIAANLIGKHRRAEVRLLRALARTGLDPLADIRTGHTDHTGANLTSHTDHTGHVNHTDHTGHTGYSDHGHQVAQVDNRLAASAAQRALSAALASLAPGDRDVLLLVAWADLSYEEVAQALSIPVGTVRSRLNRARRITREALADYDPKLQDEEFCR